MQPFVIVSGIEFAILLILFVHLIINLLAVYRLRPTARGSIEGNPKDAPMVSMLVPAHNEADHIEICVRSMVQQNYERLEVLVLDDNSSDGTAAIVQQIIDELQPVQKERLQLLHGEPLPQGWVGKNFACYQLAQHAQGDYLFFSR